VGLRADQHAGGVPSEAAGQRPMGRCDGARRGGGGLGGGREGEAGDAEYGDRRDAEPRPRTDAFHRPSSSTFRCSRYRTMLGYLSITLVPWCTSVNVILLTDNSTAGRRRRK